MDIIDKYFWILIWYYFDTYMSYVNMFIAYNQLQCVLMPFWWSNMAMETLQTFGYEGDRGDIFLTSIL